LIDVLLAWIKEGKKMNRFKSVTNPLMWFMAMLLSALAAGCGGGGGGGDPILGAAVETISVAPAGAVIPGSVCPVNGITIPTVTATNPTDGNLVATTSTTGVANNGKVITATFSLAMDPATINTTTFTLAPVGGAVLVPASVVLDASGKVATLTTTSALIAGTQYLAIITQGASSASVPMGCSYAWNFTTIIPAASGPAPVNLGSLSSYAIASSGGISNTGATQIDGNVVLNPNYTCNLSAVNQDGTFTGCSGAVPTLISPWVVVTPSYPDTTTASSITAALLAKWNSISPSNLPGATVLGCGTIGSLGDAGALIGCSGNSILAPGVYISQTSSTIGVAGILTLNGGPDDVWVFQAPSALNAEVGSQILLTGGAKASNVWWFVGSSATLKTNTIFQGSILASASVTMQNLATSCGRLLSGAEGAGAFVFDANKVSVPGNTTVDPSCL